MMQLKTGDKLVIRDVEFGHEVSMVVELVGATLNSNPMGGTCGPLLVAKADAPYQRIHLSTKGIDLKSSTPNRDNMLVLEKLVEDVALYQQQQQRHHTITCAFVIRTQSGVMHQKDKDTLKSTSNAKPACCCLAINAHGELVSIPYSIGQSIPINTEYGTVCNRFALIHPSCQSSHSDATMQVPSSSSLISSSKISKTEDRVSKRYLKKWQLRRFLHEGYLHLPEVIPRDRIDHCVTFLTHHMGQVGCLIPGGVQGKEYGKFPGQISNSDVIRNLVLKSQVQGIVEELFGCAIHSPRSISAQIAFRFPQFPSDDSKSTSKVAEDIEWHTDGYRQGHSHPFSILLGVSLSAVENDFEGNLSLWPGSHFLLHQCRRGIHGGLDLEEFCKLIREDSRYSDLYHPSQISYVEELQKEKAKLGNDSQHNNSSSILPCIGKPLQIRTKPGDIILLHPDLAHGGAPNFSPTIRQMLYFRLKVDHGEHATSDFKHWNEVIYKQGEDLWADYIGLKEQVGEDELHNVGRTYA